MIAGGLQVVPPRASASHSSTLVPALAKPTLAAQEERAARLYIRLLLLGAGGEK